MSQTDHKSAESEDQKSKTEISLAKIGLISAIAVAAIGLISTAVSAYFSSQTALAPIKIPIEATQTAEAISANSNIVIAAKETTMLPTSTIGPLFTATNSTPLSTSIPSDTPTAISTTASKDWEALFDVYTLGSCSQPVILPESIDLEGDPELAAIQISEASDNMGSENWQVGPGGKRIISVGRNLVGKAENLGWIQLSNTARVSIQGKDLAPDHVNVMMNCAGGGTNRIFSPIDLDPQYIQYEVTTSYPEVDFFTLQPGEFESLHFIFNCTRPGTYSVKLSIEYMYLGQSGQITIDPADLVCPHSYTLWELWLTPFKLGDYTWDGTGYVEAP